MTDHQIIALLKINNRIGIKYLYEKYKSTLQKMITDFLPGLSKEKTEEILIAVMIQMWLIRDQIPDREYLFNCLAGMIKNEIIGFTLQSSIRKRILKRSKNLVASA